GLAQDFVGLAQLADLALELLEALPLARRQTGTLALVSLRLLHPCGERLGRAADFGRDRDDRRPLGCVLGTMLKHHPNSAFTNFRRVLRESSLIHHGSSLSRVGASGKPGAVHYVQAMGVNSDLIELAVSVAYKKMRYL